MGDLIMKKSYWNSTMKFELYSCEPFNLMLTKILMYYDGPQMFELVGLDSGLYMGIAKFHETDDNEIEDFDYYILININNIGNLMKYYSHKISLKELIIDKNNRFYYTDYNSLMCGDKVFNVDQCIFYSDLSKIFDYDLIDTFFIECIPFCTVEDYI